MDQMLPHFGDQGSKFRAKIWDQRWKNIPGYDPAHPGCIPRTSHAEDTPRVSKLYAKRPPRRRRQQPRPQSHARLSPLPAANAKERRSNEDKKVDGLKTYVSVYLFMFIITSTTFWHHYKSADSDKAFYWTNATRQSSELSSWFVAKEWDFWRRSRLLWR